MHESDRQIDMGNIGSIIHTDQGTVRVFRGVDSRAQTAINVQQRLELLGFDPTLFAELITLTHAWEQEPVRLDFPPEEPVEYITVYAAQTAGGIPIEVTDVDAWAPHTMKSRGRRDISIGFEAILVKEGEITYDILHGFDEEAYVDKGEGRTSITLGPGDLLIVPRPIARQISAVKKCKYVYVGDPWDENDMPTDISDLQ